jgi:hypothetical protein
MCNVILQPVPGTTVVMDKQVLRILSVCLVSLVIQHGKGIRCNTRIFLSVFCPDLPYFVTLYYKGTIFGRKSYGTQNACFQFFYKFCLKPCHAKKYAARYYHKCFFSFQCHHMSLTDFMVSPPGCGRSVSDF